MLDCLKRFIPRSFKLKGYRICQNVWESVKYQRVRDRFTARNCSHIIFVCKGNICRSAFAEHYLKRLMSSEKCRIDSCGLDASEGIPSPPEAVDVGAEFGTDLRAHRSKGLMSCDLENADVIVPMEYKQYKALVSMFPAQKKRIKLLREFAPWPQRFICNIHDPFGLGKDEFRLCFRVIQKALHGIEREVFEGARN